MKDKIMNRNTYELISRFKCCGKTMVTVIIEGKEACVMSELEYIRIIKMEQGFEQKMD